MRDTWCKRRVRVTFKDIRKQISANEKNKKQILKENKRIRKTNMNERLKRGINATVAELKQRFGLTLQKIKQYDQRVKQYKANILL